MSWSAKLQAPDALCDDYKPCVGYVSIDAWVTHTKPTKCLEIQTLFSFLNEENVLEQQSNGSKSVPVGGITCAD